VRGGEDEMVETIDHDCGYGYGSAWLAGGFLV
jgi:hypothetical protein